MARTGEEQISDVVNQQTNTDGLTRSTQARCLDIEDNRARGPGQCLAALDRVVGYRDHFFPFAVGAFGAEGAAGVGGAGGTTGVVGVVAGDGESEGSASVGRAVVAGNSISLARSVSSRSVG